MNTIVKKLFVISIVLLDIIIDSNLCADAGDVDKYLQEGTKLLAAGQLVDALTQYDKAIEGDPKNYLIYYRRATVYLAMGKTKTAIEDLTSSLELNPKFALARSQRASLYLKQGKLTESREDAQFLVKYDSNDEKSKHLLESIGEVAETVENAKGFYENANYAESVALLNKAIEITPQDQELRELRASCYMKMGDVKKAVIDMRQTVRLNNDDRVGILKLSKLLYEIGDAEQSLVEIRECLRLDPDDKNCFKHYKNIKKLVKSQQIIELAMNEGRYAECIEKSQKLLDKEPNYVNYVNQHLCTCQMKGGEPLEAIKSCEMAHQAEPNNIEIICDLADSYIANEDYDSATKQFQKALEIDKEHKRAKDGVKKAQKLLKNSKKRNYYKILGVPRSSSKKQILKAYRKLAAQYHPDRFKGSDKQAMEKKFIDITDAKDVLSDEEKRQKFDNGEDPLDPEQQHQGPSGNPFGGFTFHNFNPFEHQGGDFQYEFRFG